MATTNPQLAKALTIRLGATPTVITNLTSNSMSHTMDMIDVTTKSSGTHKEYIPAFADLTIDYEGIYTITASTMGYEDILTAIMAGTSVAWEWGTGVTGTPKLSGNGYHNNLTIDSNNGEVVTFSGSFQNTGDPTVGTYA